MRYMPQVNETNAVGEWNLCLFESSQSCNKVVTLHTACTRKASMGKGNLMPHCKLLTISCSYIPKLIFDKAFALLFEMYTSKSSIAQCCPTTSPCGSPHGKWCFIKPPNLHPFALMPTALVVQPFPVKQLMKSLGSQGQYKWCVISKTALTVKLMHIYLTQTQVQVVLCSGRSRNPISIVIYLHWW